MNKKEFEKFLTTEAISKDLGIPGRNLLLILENPNSKEVKMMLAGLFGHRFKNFIVDLKRRIKFIEIHKELLDHQLYFHLTN